MFLGDDVVTTSEWCKYNDETQPNNAKTIKRGDRRGEADIHGRALSATDILTACTTYRCPGTCIHGKLCEAIVRDGVVVKRNREHMYGDSQQGANRRRDLIFTMLEDGKFENQEGKTVFRYFTKEKKEVCFAAFCGNYGSNTYDGVPYANPYCVRLG